MWSLLVKEKQPDKLLADLIFSNLTKVEHVEISDRDFLDLDIAKGFGLDITHPIVMAPSFQTAGFSGLWNTNGFNNS